MTTSVQICLSYDPFLPVISFLKTTIIYIVMDVTTCMALHLRGKLLLTCNRISFMTPAGKGLTSLLSFVVSYCEFVTFPLVSWVRCGT